MRFACTARLVRVGLALAAAAFAAAGRAQVALLATNDLHGNLYPVDYGTGQPVDPMMLATNTLRYDSLTPGNHEDNVGLAALAIARGVPGIDLVFMGRIHRTVSAPVVDGVLLS